MRFAIFTLGAAQTSGVISGGRIYEQYLKD